MQHEGRAVVAVVDQEGAVRFQLNAGTLEIGAVGAELVPQVCRSFGTCQVAAAPAHALGHHDRSKGSTGLQIGAVGEVEAPAVLCSRGGPRSQLGITADVIDAATATTNRLHEHGGRVDSLSDQGGAIGEPDGAANPARIDAAKAGIAVAAGSFAATTTNAADGDGVGIALVGGNCAAVGDADRTTAAAATTTGPQLDGALSDRTGDPSSSATDTARQ